jgi:hypothetical protein
MSPEVLDRFGRCAVCGHREDCCVDCHRAHDYLWERFLAIVSNPYGGGRR